MNKQWSVVKTRKELPIIPDGVGVCYAVEIDGKVKIGCTKNIRTRMATITEHLIKYADATIGCIAYTKPHINYKDNERFLHSYFASKRRGSTELFDMSLEYFRRNAPTLNLEIKEEQCGYNIAPADMFLCSLFPAYTVYLEKECGASFSDEQIEYIVDKAEKLGSSFAPFE